MATMYQVRTQISGFAGGPYLSTMYFLGSGGTAQQAATAARNFWTGFNGGMFLSLVIQVLPDVRLIESTTGALTGSTPTVNAVLNCTNVNHVLPFTSQLLMQWQTGVVLRGRLVRGRTFVPGLTENSNLDGAPTAAEVANAGVVAGVLVADANTIFGVWSRPTVPGGSDGVFTPVATGGGWSQWAVLRSRRD